MQASGAEHVNQPIVETGQAVLLSIGPRTLARSTNNSENRLRRRQCTRFLVQKGEQSRRGPGRARLASRTNAGTGTS